MKGVEVLFKIGMDAAIFSVSVLSGMLGVGVAFAALPILSLTGGDLVHELQPVALFLNGVTALFSALAFGRAGHVDWPRAVRLSVIATLFAPFGALTAMLLQPKTLWTGYLIVALAVLALLFKRQPAARSGTSLALLLGIAAPVAFMSGMLGVGPGFLLVPIYISLGVPARSAAAMNAVAVVPSSFAALAPHLISARVDIGFYAPIVALAACGALLGGHLASDKVPERALKLIFIVVIACLCLYKAASLYGPADWPGSGTHAAGPNPASLQTEPANR